MADQDNSLGNRTALQIAADALRGSRGGRRIGSDQLTVDVILNVWRYILTAYFPIAPEGEYLVGAPPTNFIGAAQRSDVLAVSRVETGAQIFVVVGLGAEMEVRGDVIAAALTRLQEFVKSHHIRFSRASKKDNRPNVIFARYMQMHTNRTLGIWGILAVGQRGWIFERDPYSGLIRPLRPEQEPRDDGDESFDLLSQHERTRLEDTMVEIVMAWRGELGFTNS